jgi:hypothetical protein
MLASRHDRTVEILYGLCKAHRSYTEVYADHLKTPFKPIALKPPAGGKSQGEQHLFKPDVWAKTRDDRVDLFEVWDEQSEAGGVMDVSLAALTPNVASLSIVCFDKTTVYNAKSLALTILSSIHNERGENPLDPSDVVRRVISIPAYVQNEDAALKSLLADKLKQLWTSKQS